MHHSLTQTWKIALKVATLVYASVNSVTSAPDTLSTIVLRKGYPVRILFRPTSFTTGNRTARSLDDCTYLALSPNS